MKSTASEPGLRYAISDLYNGKRRGWQKDASSISESDFNEVTILLFNFIHSLCASMVPLITAGISFDHNRLIIIDISIRCKFGAC